MKHHTISKANLPTKLPISRTILVILLVEKFDPDSFIYFLGLAFIIILWLWAFYCKSRELQVNIVKTLIIENTLKNLNEKDEPDPDYSAPTE